MLCSDLPLCFTLIAGTIYASCYIGDLIMRPQRKPRPHRQQGRPRRMMGKTQYLPASLTMAGWIASSGVHDQVSRHAQTVSLSRPPAADRGAVRVMEPAHDPADAALFPELPAGAFARQDSGDDRDFYAPPRLVTHIDAAAIAALTEFYRRMLPGGGRVLDLMSSWVSHLPTDQRYGDIVGHGMNAQELAANPQLTRWFVQDLNVEPLLPLDDRSCDAALCCVGVQYLQQPGTVFAEVRRVLEPGSPCIVSFSNRCFPTKAVAIWRALAADGHAALVKLYLERAGFGDVRVDVLADGRRGDPLVAVTGFA
jgi:hypothetical protein